MGRSLLEHGGCGGNQPRRPCALLLDEVWNTKIESVKLILPWLLLGRPLFPQLLMDSSSLYGKENFPCGINCNTTVNLKTGRGKLFKSDIFSVGFFVEHPPSFLSLWDQGAAAILINFCIKLFRLYILQHIQQSSIQSNLILHCLSTQLSNSI